MKIEIDTQHDSPAELKLLAKLLNELAELPKGNQSNQPEVKNEIPNSPASDNSGNGQSTRPVVGRIGANILIAGPTQAEGNSVLDGNGGNVGRGNAGAGQGTSTVGNPGPSIMGATINSEAGRSAVQPEQEATLSNSVSATVIQPVFTPVQLQTVPVQFKMPWDTSAFEKQPVWPELPAQKVQNVPTSNPWAGSPFAGNAEKGIPPMFNEADMAKLSMEQVRADKPYLFSNSANTR